MDQREDTVLAASGSRRPTYLGTNTSLTARYTMGCDNERPERVPDRNLVLLMMATAIGTYAPHVKEIELL